MVLLRQCLLVEHMFHWRSESIGLGCKSPTYIHILCWRSVWKLEHIDPALSHLCESATWSALFVHEGTNTTVHNSDMTSGTQMSVMQVVSICKIRFSFTYSAGCITLLFLAFILCTKNMPVFGDQNGWRSSLSKWRQFLEEIQTFLSLSSVQLLCALMPMGAFTQSKYQMEGGEGKSRLRLARRKDLPFPHAVSPSVVPV